jgi:hypothetical protein
MKDKQWGCCMIIMRSPFVLEKPAAYLQDFIE